MRDPCHFRPPYAVAPHERMSGILRWLAAPPRLFQIVEVAALDAQECYVVRLVTSSQPGLQLRVSGLLGMGYDRSEGGT
jgi:hypothetical protein